ncbi:MAG: class I SAM-dependent methyltransferase, partial [Promethearchaeota archaeon]
TSYDWMSKIYDIMAGSFERKHGETGVKLLAVTEGERVLEIGYGTGHAILAFAQSVGETGRVYGIDISEGMRNITLARIQKASLSNRVFLEIGDAAKLPFDEKFFNAVFLSFTLELFDTPEIPIVLGECRRVLTNGGRICVVTLSRAKAGIMIRLYEILHEMLPSFIDCRPIFPKLSLKDSGFKIISSRRVSMWGIPVEIILARKK